MDRAAEFDVDHNRVAVGGDSAGGNLATVVCQIARDRGGPVTDYYDDRPSMHEFDEGYLLIRPILAESLAGLPPAMVITAECDPIRNQGEAYAQRLKESGVQKPLGRHPASRLP